MWFLLFLFLDHLHAQENLAPINVFDSSGPLLERVSTPVWHSSEQAMLENTQIQDVLNKAPGVVFTQNGGAGGRGAFYLRGSESRHTIVLTDGLRLNDPSNTDRHYDTAFLLTPFYQDLLFLRGPSPALYGGDATAGVIELVPRRGQEKPETILGLSGGSFDTGTGFVLQDWKTNQHQGTFGLIHQQSRGISRLNRKRHGASEPDGVLNTQIQQASKHQWNRDLSTELWFQGIKGRAQQDGASVDEKDDRTDNQQGSFSQTTRGKFWWLRSGMISHTRELKTVSQGEETYRGESRSVQGGIQFKLGHFETIAGLSWDGEWLSTETFKRQNDLGSIFILERLSLDKWLFEAGARVEEHQRYNDFVAYEGTISYQPSEALQIYTKGARGYKTPSLYQLYAPPLFGSPLGNPDLVPEKNISVEIGAQWKSEHQIDLIVFQQNFQDLITYSNTGYQNRGDLRVRGVELSGLTREFIWGQVSASSSILDFAHYSKTPLRRPPYLMSASWIKNFGAITTELNARAIGGRKDVDLAGDNARLVAYEILNASVKWNPNEKEQWSFNLGNITDREYEDVWGYSVAPLNFQIQYLNRF
jgi:vitamin B12 transporter